MQIFWHQKVKKMTKNGIFLQKWGENNGLVQNFRKLTKKNDYICIYQKKVVIL